MATDYPEARQIMLEALLPNATDVYIALYLGNPIAGGVELTLTGYARVAFQDWVTADLGGESERSNNTDIVWPVIGQAGDADHWAILDTPSGAGVLLRSGQLLDNLAQPITINIGVGDTPRMLAGQLRPKLED